MSSFGDAKKTKDSWPPRLPDSECTGSGSCNASYSVFMAGTCQFLAGNPETLPRLKMQISLCSIPHFSKSYPVMRPGKR